GHRLGAVDGFEGQHLLLEVGGQHQQIEELRDPGAREPQLARQGGLVGHEPALDGGLQVVREGELPGDLGGASHGLGLVGRRRRGELHAAAPAPEDRLLDHPVVARRVLPRAPVAGLPVAHAASFVPEAAPKSISSTRHVPLSSSTTTRCVCARRKRPWLSGARFPQTLAKSRSAATNQAWSFLAISSSAASRSRSRSCCSHAARRSASTPSFCSTSSRARPSRRTSSSVSLEAVAEDSAIFVASSARSLPKSSPLPAVSVSRCFATRSASEPSAVAFEMRA